MNLPFNKKVVWVTGASGAIGGAITKTLALSGANVIISSRSQHKLEELAAKCRTESSGEVVPLPTDVTSRENVDKTAKDIYERFGRIDMLVNSTSLSKFGDFLTLQDEDWESVFEHKLFAYVRTIRATLPYMIQQQYGRIVNISGRGGHQPTLPLHLPGMSANASVNLFTKGIASMYGVNNIRANVVAPGPVDSSRYGAVTKATSSPAKATSHSTTSAFNTPTITGKLSTPEEIAEIVIFLLSESSSQLNGIVLQADGGSTASL